jgi:hypothetical protein
MSLIQELKRRNVFRVGIAYIVTAWLVIQVVETLFPAFDFGNQSIRVVVIILAIGLIPTLVLAWAFELTIASVHAFRGEPDEAFNWLARMDEEAVAEYEIRWDLPGFVPLRDDPRWMALVDRYWFTPDELAAIEFEVTLP